MSVQTKHSEAHRDTLVFLVYKLYCDVNILFIYLSLPPSLQEIEKAHHQLLTRLREPLANQVSEEQQCPSVTVSRTPSLDRGSSDGRYISNLYCLTTTNAQYTLN